MLQLLLLLQAWCKVEIHTRDGIELGQRRGRRIDDEIVAVQTDDKRRRQQGGGGGGGGNNQTTDRNENTNTIINYLPISHASPFATVWLFSETNTKQQQQQQRILIRD